MINGDASNETSSNLVKLHLQVERVVDIVQLIFKMNSAVSLFEGNLEISQSLIQTIICNLLQNVKISYQSGKGLINA